MPLQADLARIVGPKFSRCSLVDGRSRASGLLASD